MESLGNKEKVRLFGDIFKTMGWALGVLKNFRVRLYLYIALLVFQAIYQIFITSKLGSIVDLAIADNIDQLISTGLLFIALYAATVVIKIVVTRFSSWNYNGIYNDLELKVYRKIMDASWEGLTEYHSGDLITRLSSDIKTVAGNTSGLVPTLIAEFTLILGAGIYIVYIDYSMIILAITIAPIVLIASRIFMGKIYKSEARIREIESQINSYNVEAFNNIQEVKAFGLGDFFYGQMKKIEVVRKKVDLMTNKYIVCSFGTSYLAGIIGASILVSWMFYRVHTGYISFGSLSVMAFLAFQIGKATEEMLDLVPTIMAYMASADRVKMLLDIPDEKDMLSKADVDSFANEGKENGITIHVEDMSFKYKNGYSVFEGASLVAHPGELIALVGPSGEGKTTMLRLLLGIVSAQQGRAYASNGKRNLDLGIQTRSIISYVPQTVTLMTGSIEDNLRMANDKLTEKDLQEALEITCIADFVEKLPDAINHKLGENGLGLSEGQKQRLAIARALLKNCPVLLMDEATSSLDVATERRVFDNIRKKYPDKTVIITTHRPTVLAMCDRVYKISNKKTDVIGQEDIQKLMDEF